MLDVTLFYRATTPEFTFVLPKDASEYGLIRVSFWQGNVDFVKSCGNGSYDSGVETDEDKVIVTLSQEETLLFSRGFVKTQVRVLASDQQHVDASEVFRIVVADVKDDEILGGK